MCSKPAMRIGGAESDTLEILRRMDVQVQDPCEEMRSVNASSRQQVVRVSGRRKDRRTYFRNTIGFCGTTESARPAHVVTPYGSFGSRYGQCLCLNQTYSQLISSDQQRSWAVYVALPNGGWPGRISPRDYRCTKILLC